MTPQRAYGIYGFSQLGSLIMLAVTFGIGLFAVEVPPSELPLRLLILAGCFATTIALFGISRAFSPKFEKHEVHINGRIRDMYLYPELGHYEYDHHVVENRKGVLRGTYHPGLECLPVAYDLSDEEQAVWYRFFQK